MVPRSMRNKSAMEIKAPWWLRSVGTSAGFTQVRSSAADCSGFSKWAWIAAPKPEERGVDKDICTMDEICDVLEAVS